jgi:hypothetical protein
MKKCFVYVVLALVLAVDAFAAGSVTVTKYYQSKDGSQMVFKLACVGASDDGSVPATQITDSSGNPYYNMGYYLYEVWTVTPASGNPDAADVAITDAVGASLFSQANVISGSVSTKTEGSITKYRQVNSPLTVTQANQATTSATWDIYIKLAK